MHANQLSPNVTDVHTYHADLHMSVDGDMPLEVTLRMPIPLDYMTAVSAAYTANRAFTRPWTFSGWSRHSAEKQVLLSGEYKLPKMDLVLTPARDRCQSCETNWMYMSYATLVQRKATP